MRYEYPARQQSKSYISKIHTEAALASGKAVAIMTKDGVCRVIPGPWQYIPSWLRREGDG